MSVAAHDDPVNDKDFFAALANGDVDAIAKMAEAPGKELDELVVNDDGTPSEEAYKGGSGSDDGPEDVFEAEKRGEQADAAAEKAAAQKESDDKAAEDAAIQKEADDKAAAAEAAAQRGKPDDSAMSPERAKLVRLMQEFPDADIAKLQELAAPKQSEEKKDLTFDELPADERLRLIDDRLTELHTKISEARWVEGDEFEKLGKEKDTLLVKRAEAAHEQKEEATREKNFESLMEAAEAEAVALLPDMMNPDSDVFAMVSGRTTAICQMKDNGLTLPKFEGQTMDPDKPNFPLLVAKEQKAKMEKGSAQPAQKPGAQPASQPAARRPIVPAPGNTSAHSLERSPSEVGESPPSLAAQAAKVTNRQGYDDVVKSVGGGKLSWRSSRAVTADDE